MNNRGSSDFNVGPFFRVTESGRPIGRGIEMPQEMVNPRPNVDPSYPVLSPAVSQIAPDFMHWTQNPASDSRSQASLYYQTGITSKPPSNMSSSLDSSNNSSNQYGSLASKFSNPNLSKPKGHSELYAKALAKKSELGLDSLHSAALEALRSYSPDNHSPPPPSYRNEKDISDALDILSKYRKSSSANTSEGKEPFYIDENSKPLRSILKRGGEDILPSSSRSRPQTSAPQPPRFENVDDEDKYLYGDSPEHVENVVEPQNSAYSKWSEQKTNVLAEPEIIQIMDPSKSDLRTGVNRSQPNSINKIGKPPIPPISLNIRSSSSKGGLCTVQNEEMDDVMIIGTSQSSANRKTSIVSQMSSENPSKKTASSSRISELERHMCKYSLETASPIRRTDKGKPQQKKIPIGTGSKVEASSSLLKRDAIVQQSSSITSAVENDASSHVKKSFLSQSDIGGKMQNDSEDKMPAPMTFVPLALRKPPSLLKSDKVFEDAEERILKKNSLVGKEDIFAEEITLKDDFSVKPDQFPATKRNVTDQKKPEVMKKSTPLLPRLHAKVVKKTIAKANPQPQKTELFGDHRTVRVKKGKKLIAGSKTIHIIKDPHGKEKSPSPHHHSKERVPHKYPDKHFSARYRPSERDHKHFPELVRSHSRERVRHRYSPSYSRRIREHSRSPHGSPYAQLSRSPKYKPHEQKSQVYSRSPERHYGVKRPYYKDKSPGRYYEKSHPFPYSRSPTPDKYSEGRSPHRWSRERSGSRDRARGSRYHSYSPSETPPHYDRQRRSYDHSPSDCSMERRFKDSYEKLHSPISTSCSSPRDVISDEKGDSDRDEKSYSRYSRRDIYEKEQKRTRESSSEKGSLERNSNKKKKMVPKLLDKALAMPNIEAEKDNLKNSNEPAESIPLSNYASPATPLTAKEPTADGSKPYEDFFNIISSLRKAESVSVPTTSSQTSNIQSVCPPMLETPSIPPPNIHNILQTQPLTYSQSLGYPGTSHLPVPQYSNVNNSFGNHPVSTYSQNFMHNYMQYDAYGVPQQQQQQQQLPPPPSYYNMPQPQYPAPPPPQHYLPPPVVPTEVINPIPSLKVLKKPESRRVCSLKAIPMGPDINSSSEAAQYSELLGSVTEPPMQEFDPKSPNKLKINRSSQALEKTRENPSITYAKIISTDEISTRNIKEKFQDVGARTPKGTNDIVHSTSHKEKRKEDLNVKTAQENNRNLSNKAFQEQREKELKHELDVANETYQELVKASKGGQKSNYNDKLSTARENLKMVLQKREKAIASSKLIKSTRAQSSPSRKAVEIIKKDKLVRKIRYIDAGSYWCDFCNDVFPTVKDMLFHIHTSDHRLMDSEGVKHWADAVDEYSEKDMDYIEMPLKGIQVIVPVKGFYCSVCQQCFPDQFLAEQHIKGRDHNDQYAKYCEEHPDLTQKYESRRARAVALYERDRKRKYDDVLKGAKKRIRSNLDKISMSEVDNEAELKDNDDAEGLLAMPKKISPKIIKFNFADKAKKKKIDEMTAEKQASKPVVYIGKNISMLARLDSSKKKASKTSTKTALADTSVISDDVANDSMSNLSKSKSDDTSKDKNKDSKDKNISLPSSNAKNHENPASKGNKKSVKNVTVEKKTPSEKSLVKNVSPQAQKDIVSTTTEPSNSSTNKNSLSNIYGPSLPPSFIQSSKKQQKCLKAEQKNLKQCTSKEPEKKSGTKAAIPLNEIMLPEEDSKSLQEKQITFDKITLPQEAPKPIPVIQMMGVKKNGVPKNRLLANCGIAKNAQSVNPPVVSNMPPLVGNMSPVVGVPPVVGNVPPAISHVPRAVSNVPPAISHVPRAVSNVPPVVSNVPPAPILSELDKDLLLLGINKSDIEPMVTPKRPPIPHKLLPDNPPRCESAILSFPPSFHVPPPPIRTSSPAPPMRASLPAPSIRQVSQPTTSFHPSKPTNNSSTNISATETVICPAPAAIPMSAGIVFEKTENNSDNSLKSHPDVNELSEDDTAKTVIVAPSTVSTSELSSPVLTHTESYESQALPSDSLSLSNKEMDAAVCQQSKALDKSNIIQDDVTPQNSTTEVGVQPSDKNTALYSISLKQMSENEVKNSTSINNANVSIKVSEVPADLKEKASKGFHSTADPMKIDSFKDTLITPSDPPSATKQAFNDSVKSPFSTEATTIKRASVEDKVAKIDNASEKEQSSKIVTQNSLIKENTSEVSIQDVKLADLSTESISEIQSISSLEKKGDVLNQNPPEVKAQNQDAESIVQIRDAKSVAEPIVQIQDAKSIAEPIIQIQDAKSVLEPIVQSQNAELTALTMSSVTEKHQDMPFLQEIHNLDHISENKAADLQPVVDNENTKSASQYILTATSKLRDTMFPSKSDDSPMEVDMNTEVQKEMISPEVLLSNSTKERHQDMLSLQKVCNINEISGAKMAKLQSTVNYENIKSVDHVLVAVPKHDENNETLPPGSMDSPMKVDLQFGVQMVQEALPMDSTKEIHGDMPSIQRVGNDDSTSQDGVKNVQAAVVDNVMEYAPVADSKMETEITSTAQLSNADVSANQVAFESLVETNKIKKVALLKKPAVQDTPCLKESVLLKEALQINVLNSESSLIEHQIESLQCIESSNLIPPTSSKSEPDNISVKPTYCETYIKHLLEDKEVEPACIIEIQKETLGKSFESLVENIDNSLKNMPSLETNESASANTQNILSDILSQIDERTNDSLDWVLSSGASLNQAKKEKPSIPKKTSKIAFSGLIVKPSVTSSENDEDLNVMGSIHNGQLQLCHELPSDCFLQQIDAEKAAECHSERKTQRNDREGANSPKCPILIAEIASEIDGEDESMKIETNVPQFQGNSDLEKPPIAAEAQGKDENLMPELIAVLPIKIGEVVSELGSVLTTTNAHEILSEVPDLSQTVGKDSASMSEISKITCEDAPNLFQSTADPNSAEAEMTGIRVDRTVRLHSEINNKTSSVSLEKDASLHAVLENETPDAGNSSIIKSQIGNSTFSEGPCILEKLLTSDIEKAKFPLICTSIYTDRPNEATVPNTVCETPLVEEESRANRVARQIQEEAEKMFSAVEALAENESLACSKKESPISNINWEKQSSPKRNLPCVIDIEQTPPEVTNSSLVNPSGEDAQLGTSHSRASNCDNNNVSLPPSSMHDTSSNTAAMNVTEKRITLIDEDLVCSSPEPEIIFECISHPKQAVTFDVESSDSCMEISPDEEVYVKVKSKKKKVSINKAVYTSVEVENEADKDSSNNKQDNTGIPEKEEEQTEDKNASQSNMTEEVILPVVVKMEPAVEGSVNNDPKPCSLSSSIELENVQKNIKTEKNEDKSEEIYSIATDFPVTSDIKKEKTEELNENSATDSVCVKMKCVDIKQEKTEPLVKKEPKTETDEDTDEYETID